MSQVRVTYDPVSSLFFGAVLCSRHQSSKYLLFQWYDAITIADIIVHLFCVVVDGEALWATEDGDANK